MKPISVSLQINDTVNEPPLSPYQPASYAYEPRLPPIPAVTYSLSRVSICIVAASAGIHNQTVRVDSSFTISSFDNESILLTPSFVTIWTDIVQL